MIFRNVFAFEVIQHARAKLNPCNRQWSRARTPYSSARPVHFLCYLPIQIPRQNIVCVRTLDRAASNFFARTPSNLEKLARVLCSLAECAWSKPTHAFILIRPTVCHKCWSSAEADVFCASANCVRRRQRNSFRVAIVLRERYSLSAF
jgi:hypothetical protein